MRFFTKEVRIALVAIVGLVVLFFGLHFLKGMPIFSNDDVYYVTFDNIDGLTVSNSVFADGYQVGNVKAIDYNYKERGKVVVALQVDNDLRIPKGSSAEISKDLMGNIQLNLLMANNPRERVEPGDTLQGTNASGLMGSVQQLMPQIEQMLPKIDSILTSVNMLLADPSIARSLHNIETVSANLTTTTAGLNQLVGQVNQRVPGLMAKADYAVGKAGTTFDNTSRLTGKLADLDIASTMAKVDQTMANVQRVTDQLNGKNGTAGLLVNDRALYDNLNATMRSADSLLIDLKSHPKRYVHFSLFGRK
ncbi:MAG: MlaD family protein [Prevotella sp.]|nr:MlaD family protein [Prevotella sp.]